MIPIIVGVVVIVAIGGVFLLMPPPVDNLPPPQMPPLVPPPIPGEPLPEIPEQIEPPDPDARPPLPPGVLVSAQGTLDDITEIDEAPHWVISGEWLLECRVSHCEDRNIVDEIAFSMTHDMMRPDGSAAHSHTYTNFGATSVDRSAGTLILEGTVLGSSPIGETPIVIRLNTVTGRFSFELPGNGHLQGEVQGAISSFE